MKKILYRIISIITFILALACFVGLNSVEGRGFLDLSNLARYGFSAMAAVFAIISVVTAMRVKLMNREQNINDKKS
ncbi:MAG: hypothetical protein E7488_07510 [Ruminococcaceae bacterium]|nr:hypothetical protein [Oscillospiraceae bacterium]